MIVYMFGRNWSVPAGLSTKEVVQYVKDIIKGKVEEVENIVDVEVDGSLDTLPSQESRTE